MGNNNLWLLRTEGVGFEPTEARTSLVFKTRAINHSTTPPCWTAYDHQFYSTTSLSRLSLNVFLLEFCGESSIFAYFLAFFSLVNHFYVLDYMFQVIL